VVKLTFSHSCAPKFLSHQSKNPHPLAKKSETPHPFVRFSQRLTPANPPVSTYGHESPDLGKEVLVCLPPALDAGSKLKGNEKDKPKSWSKPFQAQGQKLNWQFTNV
jgi:hypothetical protein